MKFEIDFSPLPDYVLIKSEGEASVEDFENILKTLAQSPRWKPGTKQLFDHRNLIVNDIFIAEMRQLVNVVRSHTSEYGSGPWAFVVQDPVSFALSQVYELLGGAALHPQFAVFYSIDEAIKWLKEQ